MTTGQEWTEIQVSRDAGGTSVTVGGQRFVPEAERDAVQKRYAATVDAHSRTIESLNAAQRRTRELEAELSQHADCPSDARVRELEEAEAARDMWSQKAAEWRATSLRIGAEVTRGQAREDAFRAVLTALRQELLNHAADYETEPGSRLDVALLLRSMAGGLNAILAGNAPAGTAVVDRDVYADIRVERARQDAKWGGPNHDEQHSADVWASLIAKHARRAVGARWQDFRKHMVRAAALAVAAAETVDRVPKAAVYADTYPERETVELGRAGPVEPMVPAASIGTCGAAGPEAGFACVLSAGHGDGHVFAAGNAPAEHASCDDPKNCDCGCRACQAAFEAAGEPSPDDDEDGCMRERYDVHAPPPPPVVAAQQCGWRQGGWRCVLVKGHAGDVHEWGDDWVTPPVVPEPPCSLEVPEDEPRKECRVCPRCSGAWRGGGRERGGSEDGKR